MSHEVIYDGDCGICDATRRWFEARDERRAFQWVPLQDPDVYRRHSALSEQACRRDMHVVAADGSIYRGFRAVRFLAEHALNGWWLPVLRWRIVEWVGRLIYRRIADERRGALACAVGGSTTTTPRWQRVAVNITVLGIVGFHVWAISGPREAWPFTSNAMFAFYVAPDAPSFQFHVYAELADGTSRPVDFFGELGVVWFDRLFFSKWYGSTDPQFPQGHFPDDSETEFVERMTDFGTGTIAALERIGVTATAIRVELERRDHTGPQATADTVIIGRYSARSGRFTRPDGS